MIIQLFFRLDSFDCINIYNYKPDQFHHRRHTTVISASMFTKLLVLLSWGTITTHIIDNNVLRRNQRSNLFVRILLLKKPYLSQLLGWLRIHLDDVGMIVMLLAPFDYILSDDLKLSAAFYHFF